MIYALNGCYYGHCNMNYKHNISRSIKQEAEETASIQLFNNHIKSFCNLVITEVLFGKPASLPTDSIPGK